MTAIQVTVVGNLTADPELKFTQTGTPVASFTVASNERYRDDAGKWQDGATSFARCNAWRELAEHVCESVGKGDRVIVTGIMQQRTYETKEKEKRSVWEVRVSAVGPDLAYATAKVARVKRDGAPVPEDPWASRGAQADEEPPF